MHLQANGILLDPRRNVMLGSELDCTETWRLNQVASLSARKVENGVDRTGEEGDGRVGEATGEEGGERGGRAAVDPGGCLGRSRRCWSRGGQRVGGGRVRRGVGKEAQFSERMIR